jgi:sigma-B regulation protein RsbU (phosphoserine phosphatase)
MPGPAKNKPNTVTAPAPPATAAAVSDLEEARRLLAEQAHAIDRLQFLVEASKVLNSTLDLGQLIDIILTIATRHTGADRGSLFLVDHQEQQIWSLIAQGLEQLEIRLPMGRGIAGSVAQSGEMINLPDAYDDPRFDRSFDQRSGYRTRSLLCLPVLDRAQKVVGVLQLLNKHDGSFTAEDVEFLQSLSVHSAIALENARLHRESVERQQMERELNLARDIQRALLPDKPPVLEHYEITVRHQSSRQVGGDYYDFLEAEKDTLLFVVADVEGKGAASALIMSNLQATLHALVMHVHSLEGILYTLNESILQSTRSRKYMTLFMGLLDLDGRGLHYINAGHIPPVVVRAKGEPTYLTEGGMVIGLFPNQRYERGFQKLEPGDLLLACTDGITEASDAEGNEYESARMIHVAQAERHRSAAEIADAVVADVDAFSRDGTHQDDKILLAIKVR